MNEVDWEKLYQDKDVNTCYIEFLKQYHQTCSKNVPKRRPKNFKNPWISSLRKQINASKFLKKNNKMFALLRKDVIGSPLVL